MIDDHANMSLAATPPLQVDKPSLRSHDQLLNPLRCEEYLSLVLMSGDLIRPVEYLGSASL